MSIDLNATYVATDDSNYVSDNENSSSGSRTMNLTKDDEMIQSHRGRLIKKIDYREPLINRKMKRTN